MGTGVRHVDIYKTELLLIASSGNTTTLWLDMNLFPHVTFFIGVANSTGVTGAAITLNQAQSSTGTSSKALAYNNYFKGTGGYASQVSTGDVLTQVTGVSGTFTSATTASTNLLYAIEVQDTDLDLTNTTASAPFNYVQLAIASGAVSATFTVWAHLYARFSGNYAEIPTALT
jgi:hypothetical protein